MAYLRWSWSPWYAYSHIDGGDGDDALLEAWHERGFRFAATAGTLDQAGCQGSPGTLRVLMAGTTGVDAAALTDVHKLAPAVDQFLFEVRNEGKIPMPPDVARRFRELDRLIDAALAEPVDPDAVGTDACPPLLDWIAERGAIHRRHPPPMVPREIRDLMQARALRMLGGEPVALEQDADERRRIAAACAACAAWPAVGSGGDGSGNGLGKQAGGSSG